MGVGTRGFQTAAKIEETSNPLARSPNTLICADLRFYPNLNSFISLAMSKFMAKRSMGVQIIERPGNSTEQWLMETVRRQAQQAGIGMPEVGIFQSPDPNAFATGMRRNDALVAVSSGLLQSMNADEVEAVLGHEISHVSNGDMITMGLLQGVVNTFVIFLSRVIGHVVDRVVFKNERGFGIGYFVVSIVAQIVLGILAVFVLLLGVGALGIALGVGDQVDRLGVVGRDESPLHPGREAGPASPSPDSRMRSPSSTPAATFPASSSSRELATLDSSASPSPSRPSPTPGRARSSPGDRGARMPPVTECASRACPPSESS